MNDTTQSGIAESVAESVTNSVAVSVNASQVELPESCFSPRSEVSVNSEATIKSEGNTVNSSVDIEKEALPKEIVISIEEAPKIEDLEETGDIPSLVFQEPTPAPSLIDGSVTTNE